MQRRDRIDVLGATSLVAFSLVMAFNQVVIKVLNEGLQPVFAAGLRSAGALVFLLCLFGALRRPMTIPNGAVPGLLLVGAFFSVEFIFLFVALDLTSVSRVAIIFYSMPVWMSLGAHYLLHGETMTRPKAIGLGLAMAGVAWAILDRSGSGVQGSISGDLCALGGALCWAGIGLTLRATRASEAASHVQLMFQVGVSAVALLAVAPLFGPFVRAPDTLTWAALAFQIVVIATFAFLFWVFLLKIYPASGVASFSFLSPVFGVFLGWAMLGEALTVSMFGALACVALGLIGINWKRA